MSKNKFIEDTDNLKKQNSPTIDSTYPNMCGSCLRLWISDEKDHPEDETIQVFGQLVPVNPCPRCIAELHGIRR